MASPSQSKVCFFFDGTQVRLENRKILKTFIEQIFRKEGYRLSTLNYIFCTDKKLLEINRNFLQHDDLTDIITFDLSEKGAATTGEIYISADRVRENARDLGIPFKQELLRVIFHGALHLCGYRDKSKADISEMRMTENKYLKKYGINVP
jgi:probable rRNA maturation factor